jgi:DNA-directed RNA polymerase specialized sigma24 family protein
LRITCQLKRFFRGLTLEQAAGCLNISLATADRARRYARAGLYAVMAGPAPREKRSGLTRS